MEVKEALKVPQMSIKKFVSTYFPNIREASKRALCRSIRFIATGKIRKYLKKYFHRGGDACVRLYRRYIVRGEYTSRNLALLFLLAVLLGASIKAVASDTLTIGFEDYKLAPEGVSIDLNTVQKQVLRKGGSLTLSGNIPEGEVCSQ